MVGAGDLHRGGPVGVDDGHLLVLQRLVVVDRTDLETLRIEGSGFLHPVLLEELVAFFLQLQGSLEIGLVGAAGLHLELGVVVPPESELVKAEKSQQFSNMSTTLKSFYCLVGVSFMIVLKSWLD